ncbi:hypothetical protein BN7_4249 [Wickerhamomyces ciferrii]|uniref:37S ribosomal protein S8, mitochondrial n=1 Tax=Wickerhamomyces ciferrii (strain ATCC 14091 / BCRC 22168 / CBS 111 / JCM 3599 / NBRC 0793 / NRRL Y-1031 F-60-10) TaxID=1206466 RepID=K0KNY7_WICCF|nr:uncharacterized protein BN7_4249 [Wickerhamomyces ciferrii]CCH44681.1 hypothetical protein BN7_4249 [Wickerhamomyces ciferrii]
MSLTRLGNLCAHLQNVTRVNLATTAIPYSRMHLEVASHLYKQGFITSVQKGSLNGPDLKPVDVTPDNIASRRLWLGLKYRGTDSVIRKVSLISKPSRRIILDHDQLKLLAAGKSVREIKPLQPSELVLVKVDTTKRNFSYEILDLAEAIERGGSGEVLCRIK